MAAHSKKRELESEKRLSESVLWKLQQEAYCQFGIEAWNQYGVPAYLTSNPYTARAYAHAVLGYLRDCSANSAIDPAHPLYLVDLGAGTGRFAYFFLKELLSFLKFSALSKYRFCYVMTDIAPANIAFWQSHPYLKPYFERGILDCAFFHHQQKDPIRLIHSGREISAETLVNPLVLICNYFFDTIPQDLFRYTGGKLEEGRITLFVEDSGCDAHGPEVINRLQSAYTYAPVSNASSYYEDSDLNMLLASYAPWLEGRPFVFPIGAFDVLKTLMTWSDSRLFLLAGDQGLSAEEQLKESVEPKLSLHGSFSLAVNYHALANYFRMKIERMKERASGKVLLTTFPDPAFALMAVTLGAKKEIFSETELAFREHIDAFEPADYFRLASLAEECDSDFSLEYLLLLIKLGNWDGSVFLSYYDKVRKALPAATEKEKRRLAGAIGRMWENFYPTGSATADFPLNLGVLLFEMKRFQEAAEYFERSLSIAELNPRALKNLAACRQQLDSSKV